MLDFAQARHSMISSQIRPCDVNDFFLLDAINEVPRENFVPESMRSFAYTDQSMFLELGNERRFLLQPMVTAKMIQALEIKPGQKILDIAAGLGYSSAIMEKLGASVTLLESNETIASAAKECLASYTNVQVINGPLNMGVFDMSPFDGILINGTAEDFSKTFLRQIKDNGRMVFFQGEGQRPHATLMIRSGEAFGLRQLFNASSVKLDAFKKTDVFNF